jgi:hypothetical protein
MLPNFFKVLIGYLGTGDFQGKENILAPGQ